MKGLGVRLLTAAVLVPLLIGILVYAPWQVFAGVAVLAVAIAMWELFGVMVADETTSARLVGVLCGIGVMVVPVLLWQSPSRYGFPLAPTGAMPTVFLAIVLMMLFFLFARGRGALETVPAQMSQMIYSLVYLGIAGAHVVLLIRLPDSLVAQKLQVAHVGWCFLVLICNFSSDTGGYFFGKTIGGPKLYPNVSPNKTWAGLFGCTVGSVVGALIAKSFLLPLLTYLDVVVLGVGIALFGQAGDFCESLIKRAYGVKDTGAILPGHGGLLDRIDALLFVGPFVFYYAVWIVLAR